MEWAPQQLGPLTKRIRTMIDKYKTKIVRERLFRHIKYKMEQPDCIGICLIEHIKKYHQPGFYSQNGTFHDYLVRRLISEFLDIPFFDTRTQKVLDRAEKNTEYKIKVEKELYKDMANVYSKCENTEDYKSSDIIQDICKISFCHTFLFSENIPKKYLEHIKQYEYKNFYKFIYENILKYIDKKIVCLNKDLTKNGMPADCDLIIGDILIDIKVSSKPPELGDILQILSYSALYEGKLKKCQIFNLLLGKIWSIDISDWSTASKENFLRDFYFGYKIEDYENKLDQVALTIFRNHPEISNEDIPEKEKYYFKKLFNIDVNMISGYL